MTDMEIATLISACLVIGWAIHAWYLTERLFRAEEKMNTYLEAHNQGIARQLTEVTRMCDEHPANEIRGAA